MRMVRAIVLVLYIVSILFVEYDILFGSFSFATEAFDAVVASVATISYLLVFIHRISKENV